MRNILLEGKRLKENFYNAKSMIKPFAIEYQKIDMCPSFCIYYREDVDFTEYKTCGYARYKPKTSREMTLIAHRKLRYFPIILKLQRLFMSLKIVEHMT